MPRPILPFLALLLTGLAACGPAPPAEAEEQAAPSSDVRLVVLVVVDQLVPWQLERLEPWLDGGFRRFAREGQRWRGAEHDHALTQTGPGHATLATGVLPARHGIVMNSWIDVDGKEWNCVTDPGVALLTSGGVVDRDRPASAHRLRAAGLAERVRAHHPGSKSVGIGGKDRAAILGAGRTDWSFWWDTGGAGFCSSTAYGAALPEWVDAWNARWWERLDLEGGRVVWDDALPPGVEDAGTAPDARRGEADFFGRHAFPHESPTVGATPGEAQLAHLGEWVKHSPWVDAFSLELAGEAVRALELGADAETDVLFVGLSACDVVGHTFGPRSREVTDLLLRTDRALGDFLDLLDEEVGEGRWVAALGSDHGVLELPESLHDDGIGSARIARTRVDEGVRATGVALTDEFAKNLLLFADARGIRLSARRMRDAGMNAQVVRARARELFLDHVDFVHRAFTSDELADPAALESPDELLRLMASSYYPGRTPDVSFVLHPHQMIDFTGTTHGSPWDYDRRVPLYFLGPRTPAEVRDERCRTVDVLPTLLTRAGIPVPAGLDGVALPAGSTP